MSTNFDEQYSDLIYDVLGNGEWKENRTGVRTLSKIGAYLEIDCSPENFPLLTTKKIYYKAAFAEMLGFIRGYTSAADFRALGCNVWNKDANENVDWLENPYRDGTDDLGRIYGAQWRNWHVPIYYGTNNYIDQLKNVVDNLTNNIDNRREIVIGWNPAELDMMCLPPCHMLMQFHLTKYSSTIDISVYQRSWDVFLGAPFNVAQYAFILNVIAKITGKYPGKLHYHAGDVHIYEPHIDLVRKQLDNIQSKERPGILVAGSIESLSDLEDRNVFVDDICQIINYFPHPPIKAEMYTKTS